jgi:hypothetical protein
MSAVQLVTVTAEELATLVRNAVADALAEHEPTSDRPALLDRVALARALGVSASTVDRLRSEGCPSIRIGDVPRFELDAVLAWLRERKGSER